MAYLPELHYCAGCGQYLGPDDGDGICLECDGLPEAEVEAAYQRCQEEAGAG